MPAKLLGWGTVKPNFSGDYVLDRTASMLSAAGSGITTAELRIEHDEPRFYCSARFASATDGIEFTFERFTDDRAVVVSAHEGSRCYWERDQDNVWEFERQS